MEELPPGETLLCEVYELHRLGLVITGWPVVGYAGQKKHEMEDLE